MLRRSLSSRRTRIAVAATSGVLALTTIGAGAAIAAGELKVVRADGTIHVCVDNQTRVVRALPYPKGCSANETRASFNVKGRVGDTGPQGEPGAAGAPGAQGPTGAQGPAGADGADGAPGPVGPQGPAGADGADGAVGPQGPAGADGAVGPQGPAGADGAVGPQGPAGADGAVGPQGPAGADGAVGPQGPEGPQGPAGADGATGPAGPAGPTGPAGADGADAFTYRAHVDGTGALVAGNPTAVVRMATGVYRVQWPAVLNTTCVPVVSARYGTFVDNIEWAWVGTGDINEITLTNDMGNVDGGFSIVLAC